MANVSALPQARQGRWEGAAYAACAASCRLLHSGDCVNRTFVDARGAVGAQLVVACRAGTALMRLVALEAAVLARLALAAVAFVGATAVFVELAVTPADLADLAAAVETAQPIARTAIRIIGALARRAV